MNIIMVFSTQIPVCEGIGSHILGLAKRLRDRGHNITLMTRGDYRGTREFEYEGFRVVKVSFYPLYPFHVHLHRFAVQKAIRNLDFIPDLIHCHTPLVPCLTKKWPLVTTFHSPMLTTTASVEDHGLKSYLIKLMGKTTSFWMEKRLLENSHCVIAVSGDVAEELRKYYHYNKDNLYTILNAVDTTFFTPGPPPGKNGYLLYIGRLDYGKGLFDLVASAKMVAEKSPDVRYYLVGAGPLEMPLKKAAKEAGVEKNLRFCGVVLDRETVLKYYQEALAVTINSDYESGPLTLLEAMACGKAVVTTPTGLARRFVEDGVNALLVNPRSPAELAAASIRLLSDKELVLKLGKAARDTVVENMDAEKDTDNVLQVYQQARENFQKGKRPGERLG